MINANSMLSYSYEENHSLSDRRRRHSILFLNNHSFSSLFALPFLKEVVTA